MTVTLPSYAAVITPEPRVEMPELEFDWTLPSGLPAEPERPAHLHLVVDEEELDTDLPDPASWTAMIAMSLLEALSGERPVGQLNRWLAKEIFDELSGRVDAARRHPAGKLRVVAKRKVTGVRVCHVRSGVVESVAVVNGAQRARSVAVRLEAVKGRWLATAIHLL